MLLRSKISKGGKVSIPSAYRKTLKLKAGDEVLIGVEDNTLVIFSLQSALEKSRFIISSYHPPSPSQINHMISERRKADKQKEASKSVHHE